MDTASDEESLQSLAQSIELEGLLEPIVVRALSSSSDPHPASGHPLTDWERGWG